MKALTCANATDGNTPVHLRLLRQPDVRLRTGLSRASMYALIAADKFPKSVPITARAVGWVESEIESWIATRVAQARGLQS